MRREFDAAQEATSQEVQVTRDANAQIKEDFEILEERFKKNTVLNEELVGGLKEEAKKVDARLKKL